MYGTHFIVGLAGTRLLPQEHELLREHSPLGVILFAHNFRKDALQGDESSSGGSGAWIDELQHLLTEVRASIGRSDILVSIDHEGGRVHRFPPGVTRFPPAARYAERGSEVAQAMASELRALGFNLTFSPSLDVYSNPENTVIGDRALSTDAGAVATLGSSVCEGFRTGGILWCGKHFPGHGNTKADSHFELPVAEDGSELLRQREMRPFKELIDAGALPLIMTAHVRYPALDSEHPATLSRRILTDILRGELGFSGVIISDDFEMKALTAIPPGERAVQALAAGVDIILEGKPASGIPLEHAAVMIAAVAERADRDEELRRELELSRERIETLLQVSHEIEKACPTPAVSSVGCEAHQELCRELLSLG